MQKVTDASSTVALSRGTWALAVMSAWSELGCWEVLHAADRPVRLDELPADLRALRISAPVLAHLGLLETNGEGWALTTHSIRLIESHAMPTGRNLRWLGDVSRLADVLRNGGPVTDEDGESRVTSGGVIPDDLQATRKFLEMLRRGADETAPSVVRWVVPMLPEGARVIDIGGGHGRYAKEFEEHGCDVTLFDMPVVTGLAEERYGDSLRTISGNYLEDSFQGPYDCAFLSNIVHGESLDANRDMARRIADALAPGGLVVYKDMFIDEQGRDPENAAFFGLTMLYYTRSGRSYTVPEVASWCGEAGLRYERTVVLQDQSLVIARKPA